MAIQSTLLLNENRLSAALQKGEFSALIEYEAPKIDQPFNLAVAVGIALAKEINKYDEILGMAVSCSAKSHDLIETASILRQVLKEELPMCLILSGKGQNRRQFMTSLSQTESKGIQNITLVTGDLTDFHETIGQHEGYLDTVQMLNFADSFKERLRFGATINPFKYTAVDLYLQYYKMMRKLFMGASYLVSQCGFDMAKFQELQWYLQARDVQVPVIARLHLISSEEALVLHNGLYAGVPISRRFIAMIQREVREVGNFFMERQLKRLELQIAGCKLFGYSGVQIVGVKEVPLLARVAEAIKAARNYTDYAKWLEAWNEYNNETGQSINGSQAFYGYKGLLSPDRCHYDDKIVATPIHFDENNSFWRVKMLDYLLNPQRPRLVQNIARQIWLDNTNMSYKNLRHIFFVNPHNCPKHLTCGACGGCSYDGTCEKGGQKCMFHQVFYSANHFHKLSSLEEKIDLNE